MIEIHEDINKLLENNSERELEEFFIEQNKLKEKPKKRKFGIDRDSDVRIFEEDIEEEEINVDLDSNGRLLDDELLNFKNYLGETVTLLEEEVIVDDI